MPGLPQLLAPTALVYSDGRVSVAAFGAVLALGFLVAVAGHVVRARALVAFGITVIFAATVLVPLVLAVTD